MEVAQDPDPENVLVSPWRTYRHALESTPDWATHRLVIQDDVEPCPHFAEAVNGAVAAQPDRLLVLAVCGEPWELARRMQESSVLGIPWARVDNDRWISAICNIWPARLIPQALAWMEAQDWPEGFTADDERIGRAMLGIGEVPLATVPSLAAHWDMEVSVIGANKTQYGHDPSRVPCCWPFPGCDVRTVDWTVAPPVVPYSY